MERGLGRLVDGGHFYEGPRWHDGAWWVSDFYAHEVQRITVDGVVTPVLEVAGRPSGLGWLPDGSLLVVSMTDRLLLRREPGGSVAVHADLSAWCPGYANDLVVDRHGGAFVGNFGFDLMAGEDPVPTGLVRVGPDGSVSVAAEGLHFPNGMVILPDERTLLVGETMGCRYSAFTIGDDGSLGERRVWAQLAPTPPPGPVAEVLPLVTVAPDGCTLDAEGCVWAADAVGGRVIRVAEGGEIVDSVAMPEGLGAFACALGGGDGRTLLVCAAPDFFEEARAAATEAVLLTVTVEVPHAGRP